MKKFIYCVVLTVLVVSLFLGCAPTPTAPKAEPIVLKALSFLPSTRPVAIPFLDWIEKVNERAKGELVIEYIGGTEVIPMGEQAVALKEGIVDINVHAYAFYVRGLVPSGAGAWVLSELTVAEERESGAYDFLVDLYKQGGFFLLGRAGVPVPSSRYFLAINKKVSTPQELSGLKVGPGSIANNFMNALGIKAVRVTHGEMSTGLERGVIDGIVDVYSAYVPDERWEGAPYVIDHPFYNGGTAMIMNLDSWNKLPQHLQDLMMEVKIEGEAYWAEEYKTQTLEQIETMRENGVEFIKFSPADAKWYLDLAYQAEWDYYMEKDPVNTAKLKALVTK